MKNKLSPIEELLKEKPSLAKNMNNRSNSLAIDIKVRDYSKYIFDDINKVFDDKETLKEVYYSHPDTPVYSAFLYSLGGKKKEINNSNQDLKKFIDFTVKKNKQDNYLRGIYRFINVQDPNKEDIAESEVEDYYYTLNSVKKKSLVPPEQAKKDLLHTKTLNALDKFLDKYGIRRKEMKVLFYLDEIMGPSGNS